MTAPAFQLGIFGAAPRAPMLRDRPVSVITPPAGVIAPRDYQIRADAAIDEAFRDHRSTLVTMATGTGKTVLFAMQARKRGNALVIAHETSLIEQAAQKLRHVTGEHVAVEKAERRAWAGAKYVVASMQTLRGDRLKFFAQNYAHIDLVVIDEAHRALAKSYRDIIAAFPQAKVLGVTATADRGDKKAMGLVFEKADTEHGAAFKYDIADATADGWLTPFEWYPMDVSGVSLDAVGLKGGDLDQDQLDEQLVSQAGQMAQAIVQHCKDLRTIVFCPGVKSAVLASEAVNRIEPDSARAIHGEMPDVEKAAIKAAHARGDFLRLFNCAILIEGYDDPRLRAVVDFAKTKSRARFAQKLGRGGRLWPTGIDNLETPAERRAAIAASPKPTCLFFDANYGKHGHTLAGPVDLLGGRYDDETKARAKKHLDEHGGNVGDALELAKAELAEEERKRLSRLAAKAAKAKGNVLVGPARAACELFGVSSDVGPEEEYRGEPFAQVVAWLEVKGVKNASSMSEHAAAKLKKTLVERQKNGFATFKMVNMLKKAGHPRAESLSMKAAGVLCALVSAAYDRRDWKYQIPVSMLDREPGSEG